MASLTKKRKVVNPKVDANKTYTLQEATTLVKEVNTTKFDSSVDLHVRLGVDPRKADQQVRGTVTLPNGTGKTKKVLVYVRLTKKLMRLPLVLISLVWTNLYLRSKVDGPMLM